MKKTYLFFFLSIILISFTSSRAQNKMSVHLGIQFPAGSFATAATSNGYGGDITIEFPQDSQLSFTGEVGYYNWGPYTVYYLGPSDSYSDFQVMIGLKYALSTHKVHPSLGLQFGMNSLSYTRTISYAATSTIVAVNDARFGISPEFGVIIPVNANLNFDANLRYNATSGGLQNGQYLATSFYGLNLGLQFML